MSRKIKVIDTYNNKNYTLSRSLGNYNSQQTKYGTTSKRKSAIRALSETRSSLYNENQSYYKYRYILQDEADDTNIVFFDSNSRKFRTRSLSAEERYKPGTRPYGIISDSRTNKSNNMYSANTRNMNTKGNLYNNKYNNDKKAKTSSNISNNINPIKINERNMRNSQNRNEIIKQLKKEKDELLGKNYSNRKSYQSPNVGGMKGSINSNNIGNSVEGSIKRADLRNNVNNRSVDRGQNTPFKNRQDYSSNQSLNKTSQLSNQREPYNNNTNSNKVSNFGNMGAEKNNKMEYDRNGNKGGNMLNDKTTEKGKNGNSNKNISKGNENEKDLDKLKEILNKKGNNVNNILNPKEKEEIFNGIKDIFNNISKGKGSKDNMEKLSQLLANMNEKDRKEILEKLGKDPKNRQLLNKLSNLVEKEIDNKGLINSGNYGSGIQILKSGNADIKDIEPLKYDGLFLDIDNYKKEKGEKNPFEGPSPYSDFYRERLSKIKLRMSSK